MSSFHSCISRIYINNSIKGTGILVDKNHVLTCSHIIEHCDESYKKVPNSIYVDFPFITEGGSIVNRKSVVISIDFRQSNGKGDLAILKLISPVSEYAPPKFQKLIIYGRRYLKFLDFPNTKMKEHGFMVKF